MYGRILGIFHIAAYSCHQICAEVMCSPSLADPSKRVRLTVRLKQHLAAIQMQCKRMSTVVGKSQYHTQCLSIQL